MSEPVKTAEIEDILSSIRRLVSESGATPVTEAEASAEPAPEASATPKRQEECEPMERLVLTPSFRVPESEPETEEGDAQSDDELTESVETSAESESQTEEHAEDEEASEDVSAPADVMSAEVSEQVGVADEQSDTAQDEEPSDTAQEEGSANTSEYSDDTVPENEQSDENETAEEEPAGREQAEDEAQMQERIVRMEAAVSDDDEWEDDTGGRGDNAPQPVETLQWEDHGAANGTETVALVAGAMPEDDLDDVEGASFDFTDNTQDAVLDEEALREMVTDIVRQELQGALGERITRNVRKLVRREIHRALMSQELE